MKTMNGFTNELLVKKAKRNWRTRCGAFLLAVVATWCGGAAQDAYGQATLSTNATWGQNTWIDDQQTTNRVAPLGNNIGYPYGYNIQRTGTQSISWSDDGRGQHLNGLNLSDVANQNVQAYLLNTPTQGQGDPARAGTYTFTTGDTFNSGGDTFTTTSDVQWGGVFNVTGASTYNTQGNNLTVGRFSNSSTFTVQRAYNSGGNGAVDGWLILNGGNNSGIINIARDGGVRVNSNSFSNQGTISVSGKLALSGGVNLGGTISGNYDVEKNRGYILLDNGDAKFSGQWNGSVTVSSEAAPFGGYILNAKDAHVSGSLAELRIKDGAGVLINSPNPLGTATVVLTNGGSLIKDNTGDSPLTLTNNITFDNRYGSGEGNLEVYGNPVSWTDNANAIYDASVRMILKGNISSALTRNQSFHVNYFGGNGAVSLQGSSNYDGAYHIHGGTLEIASGSDLGRHGDSTQGIYNQLTIGDASYGTKANFRVINAQGQEDTIHRYIVLANSNSTYEVYTGNIADPNNGTDLNLRSTLADADRFTVYQEGAITGSGSLNKAGDGVLVLTAASNGYTGDTNIKHGVLSISSIEQINDNDASRYIRIGTTDYSSDSFVPVFETTLGSVASKRPESGSLTIKNAKVEINQANSVFRTTGKGNETIVMTEVTSNPASSQSYAPVLNKEGAGTLTLKGAGTWGRNGNADGELNIRQGTVQFYSQNNLASGDITIGADLNSGEWKNQELTDPANGDAAVDYEAVLKLADGVGYQKLPNNIVLGNKENAYIDVGTGSDLAVNQVKEQSGLGADLNKRGKGSLTLTGASTYTGWTNVEEGSVTLTVENQIASSAGVDLMGENTTLDMTAADQTLRGLRGGMDPEYATGNSDEFLTKYDDPALWTRKILTGDKNLTLDIQNYKDGDDTKTNVFRGHIEGSGTVTKKNDSVFASGFQGFDGAFDIQGGTIQTLTDTTIVGLTGRAGTYLDTLGNTLTIDINTNQSYLGTIISTSPAVPYGVKDVRPHLIKDGIGTLTAGFYDDPNITGNAAAFRGDLTLKQGNIVSTTDYYMEGGGNLTFYANVDATGSVTPLKLQVGTNSDKRAVFLAGTDGEKTKVNVNMTDSATGWRAPKGNVTVGIIEGNSYSDYSGLTADSTNSLFHTIQLNQYDRTSGRDLYVELNVTGFAGVGDTYNTIAVGNNLDGMRLTDLSNNNLASLLQDIWSAGSNIGDAADRDYRAGLIKDVYRQLSGDTIANATFMGLNRPWLQAFDRLNLDCQMVYLTPPGPGNNCPAIANMRNLWFTPTVQSITARSDGNARRYSIERSGFQIGFDKRVAQNTSIGFMLGHDTPTLRQGDDRVEGNDFQFGLYAGTMVGHYVEMKGYIGFGHQNYKSNRNVYLPGDKIVPDGAGGYRPIGGTQRSLSAHGRYDGDTFQFSFEVARPLFLGFAILRPSIGLDSEHAYRYAFTETGDAAMAFERSSISRTKARFGLSLETCTLDRAIFTGRLGYSTLLGGKDYATATGQFVDVYAPSQTVRSVAVGKSYFDAGVGTRIFLNPSKTLTLVGNYDASVANRWAEHVGSVGFQYIY